MQNRSPFAELPAHDGWRFASVGMGSVFIGLFERVARDDSNCTPASTESRKSERRDKEPSNRVRC